MRAVESVLHRHAEDPDLPLVQVLDAVGGTPVSYSYREITRAARCLADRLTAGRGRARPRGGRPRVGVLCGDTPEFVVVELALLAARATGCPVPPTADPETAAALLAEVDVVIVDAPGRARLAAWGPERALPTGCLVITADTAELASAATGGYRLPLTGDDWICKIVPGSGGSGPAAAGSARVGIRAHGVAALVDSLRAEVPPGSFARCAATVPLHVLTQQVAAVYMMLLDRGCLVLPPPDADPAPGAVSAWLSAARPSGLAVTPALAGALAVAARAARRDGQPVARTVFGTADVPLIWCGSDVPDSVLRDLDSLGVPVYAGYGLPENTWMVSWNTPGPGGRRTGTVGRPLPHVRAGIGTSGELLVGGAAAAEDLTPGDCRTGRAVVDGWLHTGVRATIDVDGFVHLLDPARADEAGRSDQLARTAGPEVGRLLYFLVRSMRPASVVDFDGAFGDGLIHLAAGARDNGGGRITGCLHDARRAAGVRALLAAAGLSSWADVPDAAGVHELGAAPASAADPVDLVLLGCRPELLLPALMALEPRMRPGTVVVADGSALTGAYRDRVRESGGYLSLALPVGAGLEVSIRLTAGSATAPSPGAAPVSVAPGRPSHPDR